MKLGLREIDEVGLNGVLKGVEPLIQRLEQLEGFRALQAQRRKGGFKHAVEHLAHPHGFEKRIGESAMDGESKCLTSR